MAGAAGGGVLSAAEAAAFDLAERWLLLHWGRRAGETGLGPSAEPSELTERDLVDLRGKWCALRPEQRGQAAAACAEDVRVEAAASRSAPPELPEALAAMPGLAHAARGRFHIADYLPEGGVLLELRTAGAGADGRCRAFLVRWLPHRDPRDMFQGQTGVEVDACLFAWHGGIVCDGLFDSFRQPQDSVATGLHLNAAYRVGWSQGAVARSAVPAESRPGMADDLRKAGNAALKRGALEEALRLYQGAAALSPGRPEGHLNAALALARLGHPAEALRAARRAAEAAPPGALRDKAHYRAAVALLMLSQPEAARAELAQVAGEEAAAFARSAEEAAAARPPPLPPDKHPLLRPGIFGVVAAFLPPRALLAAGSCCRRAREELRRSGPRELSLSSEGPRVLAPRLRSFAAACASVAELSLRGCAAVGAEEVAAALGGLPQLRRLDLRFCPAVDAAAVDAVLRHLRLCSAPARRRSSLLAPVEGSGAAGAAGEGLGSLRGLPPLPQLARREASAADAPAGGGGGGGARRLRGALAAAHADPLAPAAPLGAPAAPAPSLTHLDLAGCDLVRDGPALTQLAERLEELLATCRPEDFSFAWDPCIGAWLVWSNALGGADAAGRALHHGVVGEGFSRAPHGGFAMCAAAGAFPSPEQAHAALAARGLRHDPQLVLGSGARR